ncbi:transporter substrate-binding domain-containing protein [Salegentibacter sp. F188]|uniref:Transporter substrate-binding domain-containing protein n=1 Tax=Autumnicola patrickiae TaxID=3075591 RepID=A0ABU3E0Q2_9FLAO|nr:transporter substrate-binding domain-containing protein [Salegentibacter sp. F188]MDT0689576.1 transporter substrate-binding domain-containing protein [Salegentibacter sp. F188]
MCRKKLFNIFYILILLSFPFAVCAQQDSLEQTLDRELLVGVYPQPPYVIKGQDGTWDGISIRLWRGIAEDMELNYRFIEVAQESPVAELQAGINIFLTGELTAEAEAQLDFSHIYHTADLGLASPQRTNLSDIGKAFFSERFWYITGSLSILLLIVGAIIYFVERNTNEEQFGGERSIAKGIGSGFWWAGVTMTTIGYGDKAPRTFLGRAIALVWMLVAMGVTAVLTASIVSTVMGGAGKDKVTVPNDLRDMKIAAVENSSGAEYLSTERVSFQAFSDLNKALEAANSNEIEAVLHNVPAMRYEINNDSDISLQVQPVKIDPKYYAFAFPAGSELREPVNQALLRIIQTPLWQQELDRFIPDQTGY